MMNTRLTEYIEKSTIREQSKESHNPPPCHFIDAESFQQFDWLENLPLTPNRDFRMNDLVDMASIDLPEEELDAEDVRMSPETARQKLKPVEKVLPESEEPIPEWNQNDHVFQSPTPPQQDVAQNKRPINAIYASSVNRLKNQIFDELCRNLNSILNLNPSRRDALIKHLNFLSGSYHSSQTQHSTEILRNSITNPKSPQQTEALFYFLEEVALIYIAQSYLLKSWDARGLRTMKRSDLAHLNWILSSELKTHVPMNRECWQITRPNLYSWFAPSKDAQEQIWKDFQILSFDEFDRETFVEVIRSCQKRKAKHLPPKGYGTEFFQSVWNNLNLIGFDPHAQHQEGLIRRRKMVFCPTLRDGKIVRSAPESLEWVGLEESFFQLLLAEIAELWNGPKTPPAWSMGCGLEVHSTRQMSLSWSSSRPSTQNHISEMEACDFAIVQEEKHIRVTSKSPETQSYKSFVNEIGFFKNLKGPETTLGDLQACVASEKLRPNSLMLWAREKPITLNDGHEMLKFIFGKCRLVAEINLNEFKITDPKSNNPIPKYIYLFQVEVDVDQRNENRPYLIRIKGHLDHQEDLDGVIRSMFFHLSDNNVSGLPVSSTWKSDVRRSPTPQIEWLETWPDPTKQSSFQLVDKLKANSIPLGQIGIVRSVQPKDQPWMLPDNYHGIWMTIQSNERKTRINCEPLGTQSSQIQSKGFLIVLPEESWATPLSRYLESDAIREWLDHFAERRKNHWVLNEQTIKYLPVSKTLLGTLRNLNELDLRQDTRKLKETISFHPERALEVLKTGSVKSSTTLAYTFIQASETKTRISQSQAKLLSLVGNDGEMVWPQFLSVLPPQELVSFSRHPSIQMFGSIPGNVPIHQIRQINSPKNGIEFKTDAGMELKVFAEDDALVEMIWEFVKDLSFPTWAELTRAIRIPRDLNSINDTVGEIKKSHRQQKSKINTLEEILVESIQFVGLEQAQASDDSLEPF